MSHAMPNVFQLCVLSKCNDCIATDDIVSPCVLTMGDDKMTRLKSDDYLCYLCVMMECHDRRSSTMYAAQGQ